MKLKNWLVNWENLKKNSFKYVGKDGFGVFRVVMLYGFFGIGKIIVVYLVV